MPLGIENISEMNVHQREGVYNWGEIIYKPQSTYGPRVQSSYQLMIVHSGEVEITVDGEPHLVKSGDVAFLWPGSLNYFQFSREEPTHHSWIHALVQDSTDPWKSMRKSAIDIQEISKRMEYLIKELLGEAKPEGSLPASLFACFAEAAFLDFFVESGSFLEENAPRHPSIARAFAYLVKEFRNECSLGQLGKISGLSQQHLIRLFRRETGVTPIRYLWRLREEEGARLLRETGLTVSEIADSCGFQNPYHFSRRIRHRYGKSPVALRKQHWAVI